MHNDANEGPPIRRGRIGRWIIAATLVPWSFWLLGQVARDGSWLTGFCFYLPSVFPALVALVACLALTLIKETRLVPLGALLALPPAGMVAFVENQWIRPSSPHASSRPLRLVHWNIGYLDWGREEVFDALARRRAQVYVLSEVPRRLDTGTLVEEVAPGYSVVRFGSMAVLAEGTLGEGQRLVNERELKVNMVSWESSEGPLLIFAVDSASNLLVARDPLMKRVRALIEQYRPDLVAGDFNAPRRSRSLSPPPPGYRHAYDAAGRGWSSTWPVPCPVLAIDQCLISERVAPVRYELYASPSSDHRLQELDFTGGATPTQHN
jgi:vancomycin resistance protein VanJ